MLNELLEYQEYTDKEMLRQMIANNNSEYRIKYRHMILDNMSGLSRPLKIIAKHFLIKYDNDYDKTEKALKAWLGFLSDRELTEIEDEEVRQIANFFNDDLMNYYIETLDERKTKNSAKDVINDFLTKDPKANITCYKKLKRKFSIKSKGDFTYSQLQGKNDENSITSEKIIYSVKKSRTVMKNKLLVSDCDIFSKYEFICTDTNSETRRYDKTDFNQTFDQGENKKLKIKKNGDHLLKIIAAYLLNRITDDAAGANVSVTDISNWSMKSPKTAKIDRYYYLDGKKEIQFISNILNEGTKVIYIDENIAGHFRLVDATENKINNCIKVGDIVYVDQGCRFLKKIDINSEDDKIKLYRSWEFGQV